MTKRVEHNKLVRDKVPQIINDAGNSCDVVSLNQDDYVAELKRKLIEEANEVAGAGSADEIAAELADVAEVILALSRELGVSADKIEQTRRQAALDRGGFERRLFLRFVEKRSEG